MKFATHRLSTADSRLLDTIVSFGASYALFGDRILIYGPDNDWEQIMPAAKRAGLTVEESAFSAETGDLFLVIQTGAQFEQAHPDVPIVLNASRYLAVILEPEKAVELTKTRCGYKIQRLEPNKVVFEVIRPPAKLSPPLPWIENLLAELSAFNLKQGIEHLVKFPTRHSATPYYSNAAAWATGQIEAMGYKTEIKPILVNGQQSLNVVASKPPSAGGVQDIVLVVAHLDSINRYDPTGSDEVLWPAPGADDNASGSVGLLEIARVMKDHQGKSELRFVLFGGEEAGLWGSYEYVNLLSAAKELERVKAVVCMDMIATMNDQKMSVLLEGADISKTIIDGLALAAFTYSPKLIITTSKCHYGSDHMPFIWAHRPAVLTMEGNGVMPNENIHTANDDLSHINYDLMLAILRMNTAFLAETL